MIKRMIGLCVAAIGIYNLNNFIGLGSLNSKEILYLTVVLSLITIGVVLFTRGEI